MLENRSTTELEMSNNLVSTMKFYKDCFFEAGPVFLSMGVGVKYMLLFFGNDICHKFHDIRYGQDETKKLEANEIVDYEFSSKFDKIVDKAVVKFKKMKSK